jgi:L-alanine-DL-glutamate epimerase-like enolase superfamily enzyme
MTKPQTAPLTLRAQIEKRPLTEAFHITGYTFTESEVLVVNLHDGEHTGRGEGLGVYYRHDTPASMLKQIEGMRETIERGITREQLMRWLPPGGARNALDCALWDLEAKRRGQPVWQLAGTPAPQPLLTTFTLSAEDPDVMAVRARELPDARALKLKLTDDGRNAQRVRAVRAARPGVWMMADANQGFTRQSLLEAFPAFVEAGVAIVEQPFPIGREDWLDGLNCPIPLAADESVQDHHDLQNLHGRVQVINIKLDKCGGLTEGLSMARMARQLGFQVMVGNMGGTSLSMAPAFVLGSLCSVVDLDGPVYMRDDRIPSVSYEGGRIWCPQSVWGGPATAEA